MPGAARALRRAGRGFALLARSDLSGADGTRTRALRAASASLSQLSYGPLVVSQCSREVEIVGPMDTAALVVSRWGKSQPDLMRRKAVDRHEEASVELEAVCGECIDLLSCIQTANEPCAGSPVGVAADENQLPVSCRPFALNAHESPAHDEDHVEAPALSHGPINLDSELESLERDCRFGNRSLLIRCHTSQRSGSTGWAMSVCVAGQRATLREERKDSKTH
jgi:hypothetical protein